MGHRSYASNTETPVKDQFFSNKATFMKKLSLYRQYVQNLILGHSKTIPANGEIEVRLFLIQKETTIN